MGCVISCDILFMSYSVLGCVFLVMLSVVCSFVKVLHVLSVVRLSVVIVLEVCITCFRDWLSLCTLFVTWGMVYTAFKNV